MVTMACQGCQHRDLLLDRLQRTCNRQQAELAEKTRIVTDAVQLHRIMASKDATIRFLRSEIERERALKEVALQDLESLRKDVFAVTDNPMETPSPAARGAQHAHKVSLT